MKNTGNEAAFPRAYSRDAMIRGDRDEDYVAQNGMTFRQYVAAQMMPAVLADARKCGLDSALSPRHVAGVVARGAVLFADALIEELEAKK